MSLYYCPTCEEPAIEGDHEHAVDLADHGITVYEPRRTRTVIIGGPRTGKTTLAGIVALEDGCGARSTDDVMHLGWSEASAEVATWFDEPGPWVIEGVAAVRALRKWLCAHHFDRPFSRPCDRVMVLWEPRVERLTPKQVSMALGCQRIFDEIDDELMRRGVDVSEVKP